MSASPMSIPSAPDAANHLLQPLANVFNLVPDLQSSRQFLNLLDPEGHFCFQTFDDSKNKRIELSHVLHGSLDDHLEVLAALSGEGAGVFVTVNATDGKGRKAENITSIRSLFVDLDGSPLDPILAFKLKPHIVVESSPGRWHAYWLVDGMPLAQFKHTQKAIASCFSGDSKVCDLPRVMRLPGFYHRKADPVMPQILKIESELPRYTAEQVLEAFSIDAVSAIHTDVDSVSHLPKAGIKPQLGRNNYLTSVAGRLRRQGLHQVGIASELHSVNAKWEESGLPSSEIEGIAKSIARYPAGSSDVERSMTDVGNANRFVNDWGSELRYISSDNQWMAWTDGMWVADRNGAVIERAKDTTARIYNEAAHYSATNSGLASRLAKHASNSQQESRIKAMISLARSQASIPVGRNHFDADELLLGVNNGVIDLRDSSFGEAKPSQLISKRSPVNFNANAKCPQFEAFLLKIMGGNTDLIDFLQRAVGYTLTGRTTEQCLFFLHGAGSNGKSTLLNILAVLMGDYAVNAASDMLIARPSTGGATSAIAALAGARFVVSNEVADGSKLDETLVKQLTGGDKMTARKLYCELFEFTPNFKLWIAGNYRPVIKGGDHGIWRRIKLIPFDVTIPEADKNLNLPTLLRDELPGILNWALEGCRKWQTLGLKPPAEVTAAVEEYRSDMDEVGHWIAERCIQQSGKQLSPGDAYRDYRVWAEASGLRPMSKQALGHKLTERGISRKHTKTGDVYQNIGLTDAAVLAALRAVA